MTKKRLPLVLSIALVSVAALQWPGVGFWGPVLMLGGLIFLHEGGHFLAAKYMGMPVEVFSLGFGQAQAVAHGREQLQRLAVRAAAAAQTFAIHRQALEDGNLLRHHP